jgi:hypothetical protein
MQSSCGHRRTKKLVQVPLCPLCRHVTKSIEEEFSLIVDNSCVSHCKVRCRVSHDFTLRSIDFPSSHLDSLRTVTHALVSPRPTRLTPCYSRSTTTHSVLSAPPLTLRHAERSVVDPRRSNPIAPTLNHPHPDGGSHTLPLFPTSTCPNI